MEVKEEILRNEHDERLKKILNKKKRRKRIRRGATLLLILVVIGYFTSDISKVKSIKVTNNHFYSEEDILNQVGINYESRYILQQQFIISYKVKDNELLDGINVYNDWYGGIVLEVNEKKVIGYTSGKDGIILFADGSTIALNEELLKKVNAAPLISNIKKENYKKLAEVFNELEKETINSISEIRAYKTSYDDNMLELIMQDGNKIRSTYKGIEVMKAKKDEQGNDKSPYKEILKELKGTHVCLVLDEVNHSAYKEKSCE
ncbi:MAG: FtsQ-type POTRA domain-containing protein [Erysipelotrichaceae bacterium]